MSWLSRWSVRRPAISVVMMIVSATSATSLLSLSAIANNSSCAATSVLDDIDRKNRNRLESILDAASRVANAEAVLWRIDKQNIPPSYLFGTIHVIDGSLQELSPAVRMALDQSKTVVLESVAPTQAAISSMAEAGPLMVSKDGELQRVLADNELSVVEAAVQNAGYPAAMVSRLKPWAATMFLSGSKCQDEFEQRGLKSIDTLIKQRAEANGQRLVGLETMLEQYRDLAAISDDVQIAWLKASIELHDHIDDISHTISELYRFRRIEAVWQLTREMAPQAGLDDAMLNSLRNELVTKRNQHMLDRALPLLENGAVFIAVGALHQTGPDGLVALLRGKGFAVEPLE